MSEMATVGLREKNQITIPSKIAKEMGIRPGEDLLMFERDGMLTIIPKVKDPMKMAGFLGKDDTKDFKGLLLKYRELPG